MLTEIYKGIGLGLSILLGGLAVWWYRRQKAMEQKARNFDIEVYENETHEKVGSMDPDSLVDEVNKWAGRKPDGDGDSGSNK